MAITPLRWGITTVAAQHGRFGRCALFGLAAALVVSVACIRSHQVPRSPIRDECRAAAIREALPEVMPEAQGEWSVSRDKLIRSWRRTPSYRIVRSMIAAVPMRRTVVRLEYGYLGESLSVWIVDAADGRFVLTTGPGDAGVRRYSLPDPAWERLEAIVERGRYERWQPRIRTIVSDIVVRHVCWEGAEGSFAFVHNVGAFPPREAWPKETLLVRELLAIGSAAASEGSASGRGD